MRRQLPSQTLTVLALALLLAVLAAVPALASAEVRLTDDGFRPDTVRVDPGEDIVWVNATDEEQTVVGEDGTWDSGPLQAGETFSVALRQPGTFRYATADGELEGTIVVRPPADEVAAEADDGADEEADEPAAAALPVTGQPAAVLVGWALLLLGAGVIVLHRADAQQARASR